MIIHLFYQKGRTKGKCYDIILWLCINSSPCPQFVINDDNGIITV